MKTSRLIIGAIVGGIIITLLTGVIDVTPVGLIGSTHYGFPLAWRFVCVGCLGQPSNYEWANFVVDFIVWTVVVAIIVLIVAKARKK